MVYSERFEGYIRLKKKSRLSPIKPILKWAGGKTQLLNELLPFAEKSTGRYIEPFIGGGALFFALNRPGCIISDSNPELINMYQQIALSCESVVRFLETYHNEKEEFYTRRKQDWKTLDPAEAAARTIYLNKTCYNGLYRVNKKGEFNVPFGGYKNPKICDRENLYAASKLLKETTIICSDFADVIKQFAKPADFIFMDPPYFPISEYSDFKRYTKEQFRDDDQARVADIANYLAKMECSVVLTNSNRPEIYSLYDDFDIKIVPTKRLISSKTSTRSGKDLILTTRNLRPSQKLIKQVEEYPSTRYMGSKSKMLPEIWTAVSKLNFNSVLDMFAGSGIVSYMFKAYGKQVFSNDYMAMSSVFTKALVENEQVIIPESAVNDLFIEKGESDGFVSRTFKDLYYPDADNRLIDTLRSNIAALNNEYERAIAMMALIRACIKKRPRGIFTYTGQRYDDGRADLKKTLETQFREAIHQINGAVFSNGKGNCSITSDAMELDVDADLIYMDPPYYSPHSDNEYVRRYHFVEGLARSWDGVEIQEHTKTKKFKSYPTPFSTYSGALEAFEFLLKKYKDKIIVISYSSNSLPTKEEIVLLLSQYKSNVEVHPVSYRYSFGTQNSSANNKVKEYLFIGY